MWENIEEQCMEIEKKKEKNEEKYKEERREWCFFILKGDN